MKLGISPPALRELSQNKNNMNQHIIRKWKANVSPPQFRRGGSAHNLALWHYLLAETGWLKLNSFGNFNHLPQIRVNKKFSRISDWFARIWVLLLNQEEKLSVHQ
jgi:hypothetical protein